MIQTDISRFPFPFTEDEYRYSINLRPLDPPYCLDVNEDYANEIREKRDLLGRYHGRCYQSFPHTLEAQWEVLELLLRELSKRYSSWFELEERGNEWTFRNHFTAEEQTFVFGDAGTLPYEPLDFVGRHVQEDLIILMQRDGDLYMDAGQLCFPANWSLVFDLGMTYTQFHSPVPVFSETLASKVRDFLMRMEVNKPWTRLNWTMTVGRRLETSAESYHEWRPDWKLVTSETVGELVHLRVEVQNLFRLPRSNAILFSIHTYLRNLDDLTQNPAWLCRMHRVFETLPDYMAEYKAISRYVDKVRDYLKTKVHSALVAPVDSVDQ